MNLANIDWLQKQLASLRPLSNAEIKRLREEFMVENTYNSNAIEGNTLTLRETALILNEGITIAEKPLREHLEAIGHKDAFEFVLSLAQAHMPLTERSIKDIHSLVLMNDAMNKGVYRRVPVRIMGALHTPVEPLMIEQEMIALLAWYQEALQTKHVIEAVSEFHLRFEAVHPFIDGNGRTGRLLLNLELMKAGLLPVNVKFSDRRHYYDCFDSYHLTGNAELLSALVAGYEADELKRCITMLDDGNGCSTDER